MKITEAQVQTIRDAIGPIATKLMDLDNIDLAAGAGTINDHTRCLWTKDGSRIDIWARGGSIGAVRHDPNP